MRNETRFAWRNYVARAFGHDQIRPVSGGFVEFFVPGHPMGLTIVEALDTLWLMELDAELEQGLAWVRSNLSFDVDASFQVFETNIRMLGGLLSAFQPAAVRDPRRDRAVPQPHGQIGPPADSFYEYLFDGWDLFRDADLKSWYDTLTAAIVAHQAETRRGRLWFGQVDAFTGRITDRGQSELAAFYAGLLAQGGDVARGRAYHNSWNAVQDRFGVLPEGINYTNLNATSRGNQLRPEFADSALVLWLITRDEVFRQRALTHYQNMKRTSRVQFGYTILNDVTTNPVQRGDFTPGYWWSEQLKYYWLVFAQARRFDYANNYLSTEGNIFRGARR